MNLLHAVILGLVEGLTEFLPVSSTGHLILSSKALGVVSSGAFEVVIQAGAILAVIWHYRVKFFESISGFLKREPTSLRFWTLILVAFLPAAILGLSLGSLIKTYLFGPTPVIIALIVGGIVMILIERRLRRPQGEPGKEIEEKDFPSTYREAFLIGCMQCFALWPGTSRSMSTILGARLLGFSPRGAAAFSFWLAIPTLLAASSYDALKHRNELFASSEMMGALLVGTVLSFVSGLIVIRAFLGYLQKNSLEVFGWYRIVFGLICWAILLS